MADSFRYGNYTFSFVRTVSFEDEPELDPSGTDRIHNKYRITIQGVIATGVNPSTGSETAAETLRRIREDLMAPRQTLLYGQNNKTVIEITDPPDAANGPFPISFRSVMVSPGSITVEFTVEVRIVDCELGKRRGWSSNRWEQTDAYDKLGYCTTTTRGTLISRSDLREDNGGKNPDDFRGMATPAIRNGFQREDWKYTITADGLHLNYEFEDKEYYLPPPLDCLEWDGEFSVIQVNGQHRGQCTVNCKGGKKANKAQLWQRANQICISRILPLAPQGPNQKPVISQVGFREVLNGAEVEVFYSILLSPESIVKAAGTLPGQGGSVQMFGANLIGNPIPGCRDKDQPAVGPRIRGNHPLIKLVASIFHDPCYLTAELRGGPSGGRAQTGFETTLTSGGPLGSVGFGGSAANGETLGGTATVSTNQEPSPIPFAVGNKADIVVTQVPNVSGGGSSGGFGGQGRLEAEFYQRYTMRTTYLWDGNVTTCVPTDAEKQTEFVKLGPPVLRMKVEWVAERIGTPPLIPHPCPPTKDCPLYELLEEVIERDSPKVTPTGDLSWKIFGIYWYGVTDPTRVELAAPVPPFIASQLDTQEDVFYFRDSIWKFQTNSEGEDTEHWARCVCDESDTHEVTLVGGPSRGVPGEGVLKGGGAANQGGAAGGEGGIPPPEGVPIPNPPVGPGQEAPIPFSPPSTPVPQLPGVFPGVIMPGGGVMFLPGGSPPPKYPGY